MNQDDYICRLYKAITLAIVPHEIISNEIHHSGTFEIRLRPIVKWRLIDEYFCISLEYVKEEENLCLGVKYVDPQEDWHVWANDILILQAEFGWMHQSLRESLRDKSIKDASSRVKGAISKLIKDLDGWRFKRSRQYLLTKWIARRDPHLLILLLKKKKIHLPMIREIAKLMGPEFVAITRNFEAAEELL